MKYQIEAPRKQASQSTPPMWVSITLAVLTGILAVLGLLILTLHKQ